jgi:phosphate starvation-inducible PhoH-like protein
MEESITIVLDNRELLSGVCGANDGNLKVIEGSLGGRIAARGNEIRLEGVDQIGLQRFKTMMDSLISVVREGESPSPEYVRALAGTLGFNAAEVGNAPDAAGPEDEGPEKDETDLLRGALIHIPHGFNRVYPRGRNQAQYILGMRAHEISFCIGPAGTGKTYLAIAEALQLVLSKKLRKLVLTRPVVEAGESLGFLPGDLTQKINPYLRPLYDAMDALVP